MSAQQEKFKAIADKIREKTGTTEPIVPNDFANKIDDVYAAGVTDGKKTQYDEFWDNYQENGERQAYGYAFSGKGWTAETFKPKYDIISGSADIIYIFARALNGVDLTQHLKDLGRAFNTDKCQSFNAAFGYGLFTTFPSINTSSAIVMTNMFRQCTNLRVIEKLILREDGKQTWSDSFYQCTALEEITLEGVIGTNIDFKYSPLLTKESITSIITALSETTGATLTLSQTAVNAVDWNGTVIDGVTYNTWKEVIGVRNNWTIGLL